MIRQNKKTHLYIPIMLILTALLGLYVLVPQYDSLQKGINMIPAADTNLLLMACALVFGTYFMAAVTIQYLAIKHLPAKRTLLVQYASGFAGKLVPAGVGGMALNARYLQKQRLSVSQASAIVVLNALLGFAGHILIILLSLLFAKQTLGEVFSRHLPPGVIIVAAALIVITLITVLYTGYLRRRLESWLAGVLKVLTAYRKRQGALLGALLGSIGVTVLFTAALYCVALSLGIRLTLLQVLLVYTASALGSAVTPTPGGIGGAEAALAAALIAANIPAAEAVSVAVTYRLIAFWLPLAPGLVCFQLLIKKHYI